MSTIEGNKFTVQRCSPPTSKVSCQWKGSFIDYSIFENLALKVPYMYDVANYFHSQPTVHFVS